MIQSSWTHGGKVYGFGGFGHAPPEAEDDEEYPSYIRVVLLEYYGDTSRCWNNQVSGRFIMLGNSSLVLLCILRSHLQVRFYKLFLLKSSVDHCISFGRICWLRCHHVIQNHSLTHCVIQNHNLIQIQNLQHAGLECQL